MERKISKIIDYLYVSSLIDETNVEELLALTPGLVISMVGNVPSLSATDDRNIEVILFKTHDSFLKPIPLEVLIKGVKAAIPVIKQKRSVIVFCREGRRRSIAMTAAIMIGLGYYADEAIKLIHKNRAAATPRIWYIKNRIKKFEDYWKKHS